jgi:hypothetical protein
MDNDLLNMSLKQGKQFNVYQTKIKQDTIRGETKGKPSSKVTNKKGIYKKGINKEGIEGFVSLQERQQKVRPRFEGFQTSGDKQTHVKSIDVDNQKDLDELNQLKSKYNEIMQQYESIQQKIIDSVSEKSNRMDKDNPYLGKYIKFTDGTICYVTNEGIARPYINQNNCPIKQYININIPWKSSYVVGTTIPTVPPLLVGSNMKASENCANNITNANVYASSLVNNLNSKYIGCYNDTKRSVNFDFVSNAPSNEEELNGSHSMTLIDDEDSDFYKCQYDAYDNGYKYFGLQDVQNNGKAKCVVSNDISMIQKYGDGSKQIKLIPIWSSNTTSSGASCYVSTDGRIIIHDNSGLIWQSSEPFSGCLYGGYVNPKTIEGSWGGNCVGKPLNIDCGNPDLNRTYGTEGIVGNLNSILKNKASEFLLEGTNPQYNWSFNPIEKYTGADPAACCSKLIDYSYQCGGAPFKTGQISGGSNINFDCSDEVSNCNFVLTLQSDGNLCLVRKTKDNSTENVWCSATVGKQNAKNPDWVSTNGKYGRNYLKMNEVLGPGEWIGSVDGSLKLIMQMNGNLVLYTSEITSGCSIIDNKHYGGKTTNAVYELDTLGNKSSLGKFGYIDSDSKLRQYPDSMVGFTNTYRTYRNTDSVGNNIKTLVTPEQYDCETECNNNPDCSAYVYQGSSQTCWLKNNSAYPKGQKQKNNATILGVRNRELKNSNSCFKDFINIDTIQYDNYVKGEDMTPNTRCVDPIVPSNLQITYDNIVSQIIILGNDIISKMEDLYNQDNKIFEKLNTTEDKFNKELEKYKQINLRIQKKIMQTDSIEGMQNLTNTPDITDLSGMLSDSDLRVLKENYSYILWTILAVSIITVTINIIKK